MFNRLLRLALPLLLALAGAAASAVTLKADAVDNVSESGRSLSRFLTVNWADSDPNVGLIAFDLSGLSGDSFGATLNLFQNSGRAKGAVFALYMNTSDWSSGVSSWSDRPTHDATPIAYLTIDDNDHWVWRSVDVSTAVELWMSGSRANYGFTLERLDSSNPVAYFAASQDLTPTMSVTSVSEVPEPESWALFLAGGTVLTLRVLSQRRGRARAG